jgi:hypothetical protein
MKSIALIALPLALAAPAAVAGNSELSLAALVGAHSPHLNGAEKALLGKYLDSHAKAPTPRAKKIVVTAERVTCRISDVDVTYHACELDFGGKTVSFEGRKAHELYATLVENGAPSEGAAGSIYEGISKLDCAIEPAQVKEEAGGGASCSFKPSK